MRVNHAYEDDMTQRTKPPFRAEHLGSLIRPPKLRAARESWMKGKLDKQALKLVEDECIREAVAMQERIGMPSISDGEFRREHWMEGFHRACDGFSTEQVKTSFNFTLDDGTVQDTRGTPKLVSKLKRREGLETAEFAFTKSLVKRGVPKATMPSPSMVHHGAGDAQIDKRVYSDRDAFMADVVAIYREEIAELGKLGCTFVQLDECALPVLCDPRNREKVKQRGESPEANMAFYADAINAVVRGRPAGMTICVHMCRGNRGQGMASGGYDYIAERVFGELEVDGYLLEFDSPRAGDFSPLRQMRKGTMAILGLVSTKVRDLETVEALKRRVDEASRYIDMDRMGLCPQCGFASSFTIDRFTQEDEERKLGRIVEAADGIWR
jgi:5-methyltetrahydropteroyltriglutamate--homocysteine methyltransferase